MKVSCIHYHHTLMCLLLLLIIGVVTVGCSDDESADGVDEKPLTISMIIINPKSIAQTDTLKATAIAEGSSVPGSFPTYKWTKTGGTFLTDNQASVEWVAPGSSAVFRLTCTVTNSGGSSSAAVDVFVGRQQLVIPEQAGEVHLLSAGLFYYLRGPVGDAGWDSSKVYLADVGAGPGGLSVLKGSRLGDQFVFSKHLANAAHSSWGEIRVENTTDPIDVWLVGLDVGRVTAVTSDRSLEGGTRHQQYQYPYFSADENLLTYQGFLPAPQQGEVDTVDVFVHYIDQDKSVNATRADTQSERRRNLYPTISSDDSWLVFVSDRGERDTWDFYGLPIVGGVVDTLLSQTKRLTTAGLVGLGPWTIIDRPLMTWNPSSGPVLAVLGDDDVLYFVETNAGGANTRAIQSITGDISELDWSTDGQTLAVSASRVLKEGDAASSELYTVPIDGSPQLRHTSHPGDKIVDVTWSPDGEFIVYRVIRIDQAWFELIDIDGGTDFLATVVLSATAPLGDRSSYAAQMSTDSAYGSGDVVYMLFFEGLSPRLSTLDISGAPL